MREDTARPLTRPEKVLLAGILLAAVLFNAVALLSEVTIPVPSLNDDMLHWLFIQRASEALASGQNVFDHWLPQIELGVAQFFYYQHLPHLAVVLIERLSFGALDLLTTFNLVRYVLMVTFPLTVFWSLRRMGFSGPAAVIAGAASSLLVTEPGYGFDYLSYTWRGFGTYTQLWAMHLTFITLACMVRLINTGRGITWAILAFSLLVLSHLIYAYMMALTVIVLFVVGLNRENLVPRIVRIGTVAAFAGVIASYMVIPFALEIEHLNATPYLQPEKYNSYGIVQSLRWLIGGDLLDDGRLPILTGLFGIGLVAALVSRLRLATVAVALLILWFVLYAGRTTLGSLADALPFGPTLLYHRFIGGVHLAAILLIGIGGAVVWHVFAPQRATWRALGATLAIAALSVPVLSERIEFYRFNDAWMARSMAAVEADADAAAILQTIETLPPGRVYAGLRADWGEAMRLGDLRFYHLLMFRGIEGLPPPNESMSLNSDFIWDFQDGDLADYALFNVRYVVAPPTAALPDFLRVVQETPKYTLYEAPSGGYAMYGTVVERRAVASQRALFTSNLAWFRGQALPRAREFIRYDFPARDAGAPPTGRACPDGGTSFELFQKGRIDFVVGCSGDSTLIIKTTFHPNWRVSVDGQPAEPYMVSPSLIGVDLPAGPHAVTAEYVPTPLKLPLLVLGLAALLIALISGPRLDDALALVLARLPSAPRIGVHWPRRRIRVPSTIPPTAAQPAAGSTAAVASAPAAAALGGPIVESPLLEPALPDAPLRPPVAAPLRVPPAPEIRRATDRAGAPRSRRAGSVTITASAALARMATHVRGRMRAARGGGARSVPASPAPSAVLAARIASALAHPRAALPIAAAAGGSALLYILVYLAQRAVNLDGSASSLDPKAPGQVAGELRLYYLATLALFAIYIAVIALAWRRPGLSGLARTLVLGTPVVIQLGLMLDRPYLSTDVLSYLAHGYVGIARGVGNAYTELSRGVLGTNLGDALTALGWRPPAIPSPYGPLWSDIEAVVMRATTRVPVAILTFKIAATLASIASMALVWKILGHVRPERQLLGTVLFAWNPAVIVELAGEGHNDALMLAFALAGLLLTVRAQPVGSLVATTLGILTKYVPALLVPPQVVYLWRAAPDRREIRNRLALGAAVSAGVGIAIFVPVWVGLQTFEGLRASGEPGPWPTVSGALFRYLERTRPGLDADLVVRVLVQGLFVAYLAVQSLRVRSVHDLLDACAKISVAYLLFGSPVYFPWYAVLPVAMLALVPRLGSVALVLILSSASRMVAPLVDLQPAYHPIPIAPFQVVNAGILIGLAAFLVMVLWSFLRWASLGPTPVPSRVAMHDRATVPAGRALGPNPSRFETWIEIPALARRAIGRFVELPATPSAGTRRGTEPDEPRELTPEEIAARTAPPGLATPRPRDGAPSAGLATRRPEGDDGRD